MMKNAETAEAAAHKTGCLKFFSKIGGNIRNKV